MTPISRGFGGHRRDDVDPSRIPPGQYDERGSPVLSAGPTLRTPLEESTFSSQGAVDEARSWMWDEFTARPAKEVTVDIHCVTKWSKLDTRWKASRSTRCWMAVETEASWVTAFADGDYTTNQGLEDVTDRRAWIAYEYDGAPLDPEHGGPARPLVPHLYFWKKRAVRPRTRAHAPGRARLLDCAAYTARRPKATALTKDSDAREWRNAARGQANEW